MAQLNRRKHVTNIFQTTMAQVHQATTNVQFHYIRFEEGFCATFRKRGWSIKGVEMKYLKRVFCIIFIVPLLTIAAFVLTFLAACFGDMDKL